MSLLDRSPPKGPPRRAYGGRKNAFIANGFYSPSYAMTSVLLQHVIALLLEEAVKLSITSGDDDQRKALVEIWR